ncbi:hypothetical protein Zm00014a_042572, partial [Zea mays]
ILIHILLSGRYIEI